MTEMSSPTRIDDVLLNELRSWEGRCETHTDQLHLSPVTGLSATLGRADVEPVIGDVLPPLWHWLYFLPQVDRAKVGEDGHPRKGGFMPPVPLPRRMWAGGRLEWRVPAQLGDTLQKTSEIVSITHKSGRSGDLLFATVRHEFSNRVGLCVREEQDIVYREMARPGEPSPKPLVPPSDPIWIREILPDPVLLFRYSALTFNSHRIHYDRNYAMEVEAYPALVVHGPLIATLLADLVRCHRPDAVFAHFSFRAVRPLFDIHPFRICGQPSEDGKSAILWAQDHEGWLAMQAQVQFQ